MGPISERRRQGQNGRVSDERLRELERCWQETGTVEDEAAFLSERIRVGSLDQRRLELAAYCGHEASSRVWGALVPDNPPAARSLLEQGREVEVRASLCEARLVTSTYPWRHPHQGDGLDPVLYRAMFDQAEAWLVGELDDQQFLAWYDEWAILAGDDTQYWHGGDHAQIPNPYPTVDDAAAMVDRMIGFPWDLVRRTPSLPLQPDQHQWFGEASVRECLRADIVPWLLGQSDPIRERVEARQREAAGE